MKPIISIGKLIVFLFIIYSCSSPGDKKKSSETFEEKDTNEFHFNNSLRLLFPKNKIIGDSALKSFLADDDSLDYQNFRNIRNLDDSSSILLVPFFSQSIKRYLLIIEQKDKVRSGIIIKGAWIDNDESNYEPSLRLLKPPSFYLEDFNNDQIPELIVCDRQNIGNVYNAVVKHFFSLKKMKIKYIGSFEFISHLPVENEFLIRYLDDKSNNVHVFLKKTLSSNDSIEVGTYQMNIINDSLIQFNPKVIDKRYSGLIITTKG